MEQLVENILIKTSDAELIRQFKYKDRRTFDILYDKYSIIMYITIYRIVPYEDEAPQILREAFIKIWHDIDSFDPLRKSLCSWLSDICITIAIDRRRSIMFQKETIEYVIG